MRDIIESTDWSSLTRAYGTAEDIPERWARFLVDGDPRGELANTICHQGTVYPATPRVVPCLVDSRSPITCARRMP